MMKEKKPLNIEVGQNIKQLRERAGLTQETFSELIGLGVKHVSAIECGAVGISLDSLRRICTVLSVSADDVLFAHVKSERQDIRTFEIQALADRLSRLPPEEYRVTKEILDKVLEALALNK